MKQTYILCLLMFSFFCNAQPWIPLPVEEQDYTSLFFLNTNVGYTGTLGNDAVPPKLLKTTNGGSSWSEIALPSNNEFTKIITLHFFDETTGFLTTNLPDFSLRTEDGGQTWTIIDCMTNVRAEAYFKDNSRGFCFNVDLENNFSITSDGGLTWTPMDDFNGLFDGAITDVHFPDNSADVGFAVAFEYMFKTIDGGVTWDNLGIHNNGSSKNSIFFIDSEIGFIAGENGMTKTTDGGETWTQSENMALSYNVHFVNSTKGYYTHGMGNHIYTSDDQGLTWAPMEVQDEPNNTEHMIDIAFPSETIGYAISTDGNIYKFDALAGIDENVKKLAGLYPVPVRSHLFLGNPEETFNHKYEVIDFTGKTILSGVMAGDHIDIAKLSTGMYLLKLEGFETEKFVKQ